MSSTRHVRKPHASPDRKSEIVSEFRRRQILDAARHTFAKRGLRIALRALPLNLQRGDTILTSVTQIKKKLQESYDTQKIFSLDGMEGAVVKRVRLPHASGEPLGDQSLGVVAR